MYEIISRRDMADGVITEFILRAPQIALKARPGQFVVLRANETGERIPLTVAHADPKRGTLTLIFQVVGKTTALLQTFKEGDRLLDVMGPLGHPTRIERLGTVVCLGGGTGIAIVYPVARALKEAGNRVIAVMGAKTKKVIILEEEMKSVSDEMRICTDDGSYGHAGFVTEVFEKILKDRNKTIRKVIAVGPLLMMKAVCDLTRPFQIPTVVSLNSIMVDATGMCGGCRVSVGGEMKFCCVEGPEFDGRQVDFDELIKRQKAYEHHERISMEKFRCRLNPSEEK